ncbi:MAG: glycoside hydrolase family 15 protein [Pseudomonadota bacterium]|nr:glycoside hydrolase family 15 protein [Pseudomonadota bacterium]
MPAAIADHAFLSNCRGAALVDRSGCIDWLCLPRFDSPACFASLLGAPEHGHWSLQTCEPPTRVRQRYREESLVVQTEMEVGDGRVQVSDCMPVDPDCAEVIRVVEGLSGSVRMRMRFAPRFGYGSQRARVSRRESVWILQAEGADGYPCSAIAFDASVDCDCEQDEDAIIAEFHIQRGQRATFAMTFAEGGPPPDPPMDAVLAHDQCVASWQEWSGRCEYTGRWREQVVRSLLLLKGLIYQPTGGMVAAATTSLPEVPGGVRNWDYRYCWLRDATFTLYSLLANGYRDEARQWRDWLVGAVSREPWTMHVMYRVDGSHDLQERELPWLPGHRGARPVRIGNGASAQFQLDIRGEVMDVLHVAHQNGLDIGDDTWGLQLALLDDLEQRWREPDHGIWEMRGDTAHFVHSKALAWVAFDRGVRMAERYRKDILEGPVDRWRAIRDEIRADIYENGFDRERGVFVQRYGAPDLDASLLLLPLMGFVEPDSPEAIATTDAIREQLSADGLLLRYRNDIPIDGLPGHEGAFLPCSFWLVDNLALSGRVKEATALFERLLTMCNHVGLMSEEWDTDNRQMLGNIPQALTHVGLINSACILAGVERVGRRPGGNPDQPEHRALHEEDGARSRAQSGPRASTQKEHPS